MIEELAEAIDYGAEAHALDGFALGTAEVRGENDLGFVAKRVLQRGDGFADAGIVGDDTVFERDVEINTDEDTFVGEIEVADGKL